MDVLELTFTHQEAVVTGDWAYAWGRSKAKIVVDGTTIDMSAKYLWVLRKENGTWKLARDSGSGDD